MTYCTPEYWQRGDLKPGTIVEHRTRFLVSSRLYGPQSRKHAGCRKFIPLGDVEQVVVGERWRVYRVDLRSLGVEPYWIAQGGELDEDGRPGWYTFGTFAEAINFADKCARALGFDLFEESERDAQAAAWDEGHEAGHEDARAVQSTYPEPTPNPYRAEGDHR